MVKMPKLPVVALCLNPAGSVRKTRTLASGCPEGRRILPEIVAVGGVGLGVGVIVGVGVGFPLGLLKT